MKYAECGQQRTAIAMAVLFTLGVIGLGAIVVVTVLDLMEDSRLP